MKKADLTVKQSCSFHLMCPSAQHVDIKYIIVLVIELFYGSYTATIDLIDSLYSIRLAYRQTQQGEPTSRCLTNWDLFGIPKRARLSLN
jgi:hypothetical protein